jgi:glycosyltransferase involved in cell wall biosynthesis
VSDDFPEWRLLIAGPIRDDDLVDTSLPCAEFLGSVGHDDLMTLLESASVAVLPSRDEAMPMFILEALARHACVISTTVGGIPLLLDDDCGELVTAGDATALTAALRRVLGDAGHRERLATRGNERFQNGYSAQAVFPRVEAIWMAARSASRHSATDTTAA